MINVNEVVEQILNEEDPKNVLKLVVGLTPDESNWEEDVKSIIEISSYESVRDRVYDVLDELGYNEDPDEEDVE